MICAYSFHRKGTLEIYNYMYTVYYSLRVFKPGFESVTFSPTTDPDLLGMDQSENASKFKMLKEKIYQHGF